MATFDDELDFIVHAISNKQPTINERMPCERIDPSTITILGHTLRFVGGLDISFPPGQTNSNKGVVVLAVLSFPDMQLLHSESEHVTFPVPYVPGYLGMREAPSYVRLLDRTKGTGLCPQVVFVDGNGRLHPRQAGSAVSVGVLSGVPVIGVAKEYHPISDFPATLGSQKAMKLYCQQALKRRGDWSGIPIEGELVGAAVLSSPVLTSTRPIFVSAGHKISLRSALALSLAACTEARIPEPIRFADRIGRALAKEVGSPL
ncbi:BZ3500_MvSof-1268-A1-R1_Chr6-3g08855 [Microbotryum saponariae]|uniref:BZ3500_MvSof-1268-A1-R1_Chr6-3g08855 protein n=1 Tax=Microbotryum saponariae TaxID=289078 RepID=A0A2X0NMP5_9BASI|nr:BZ3500_MvSof-1268-A1-R1_Chr6-3g08855 [Microbotryum saponariae]SDA07456.1 BZ3501_MvSof-1269-A2-R1_Chr6-2g08558 [Microbotryum saponariae]